MEERNAVSVKDLGVKFHLSEQKVDDLKDYIIRLVKRQMRYKEFWALRDVSFEIKPGERVAILGLNGAGKSTLLKVIAGVLKATEGTVKKSGILVPLLELGAGFAHVLDEFLVKLGVVGAKDFRQFVQTVSSFEELLDFVLFFSCNLSY